MVLDRCAPCEAAGCPHRHVRPSPRRTGRRILKSTQQTLMIGLGCTAMSRTGHTLLTAATASSRTRASTSACPNWVWVAWLCLWPCCTRGGAGRIGFVRLSRTMWIEPKTYPRCDNVVPLPSACCCTVPLRLRHAASLWRRLTLLGQSFGALLLAWEGLTVCSPYFLKARTDHAS